MRFTDNHHIRSIPRALKTDYLHFETYVNQLTTAKQKVKFHGNLGVLKTRTFDKVLSV